MSVFPSRRYHLLCGLQGAGFEGFLVHRLSEASYRSVLIALQPQTEVFDLCQVSLTGRLIQLTWWE